ncbi:MAG: pantetheine-phosphate adenylyltransferase [Pseudobutyrivibrio sp.]|nr:pantetheine-phosphate adenylyltransferase [Pseudobutyrivibrio sp.]
MKAIYPGSFDPITYGHLDIIERASKMCDELVIGVLINRQKNPLFSVDNRVSMIKGLTEKYENVTVDSFEGLTVDFARKHKADVIIRGLRAVTDFESEIQIAQANNTMVPELETIFMATSLKYSYLSSTVVKEFASYGSDISQFVPPEIVPLIAAKYNKEN